MIPSPKGKTVAKSTSPLDDKAIRSEHARLCGILSRAVGALGIPWQHIDGKTICESQIKAFDKYLTEKQYGAPSETKEPNSNEINGVEVPFG